ncbi:MAG: tetratricopeptide repeat protein [Phycisphaerales bacterium]
MDDRQQQIREGAGLEESRLNTEFIDFLKKYSTHVLVVIAVIAFGFFGWNKYKESRENALTAAFSELDSAASASKPENLLAVAEDHAGKASVAELARLYAADLYLNATRSGLKLGAELDPQTGLPTSDADVLDDATAEQYLTRAAEIYDAVVGRTTGRADQIQFTVGGLFGLAAVAESRGKFDDARSYYERIKSVSSESVAEFGKRAQERIDSLAQLASLPTLYHESDLPKTKAVEAPGNLIPLPGPPPGLDPNAPAGPPSTTLETTPISLPGATPETPAPAQSPAEKPADNPAPAPAPTPPANPPPAR